jgi:hypothetical protein
MVAKVSIVGVDDSVCPLDLVDISAVYPFVEWGVNLCPEPEQRPAFPSAEWLEELLEYSEDLRLRGILHGRWKSDILDGTPLIMEERPDIWNGFRWLQVDARKDQRNVFQVIEKHQDKIIIKVNKEPKFKANFLLPRDKIFSSFFYCGYSILDEDSDWLCQDIKPSFWVSVEGFRSNDNITMDLEKICKFLSKAEDFVTHDSLMHSLQHKTWRE